MGFKKEAKEFGKEFKRQIFGSKKKKKSGGGCRAINIHYHYYNDKRKK